MLNFSFLEKGLGKIFQMFLMLYCILLTDQISLFDYLYVSRYSAICVLQLFANQVGTSFNLKLDFFEIKLKFSNQAILGHE